ncbi:MAG TPA: hypothetical protein VLF41_03450 [Candidatus Nanoarchaeia archaeon]|nr:hypothetical protein [Candidatus Nanoarchaeia archaeon]
MAKPSESLDKTFNDLFVKNAPYQLPANAKEAIVKWSPWITLILLILFAPALLAIFTIGTLTAGVAGAVGVNVGPLYYLAFIVLLVQLVVMAISIPKLMKRQYGGWQLVYYSALIGFVYAVLNSLAYGAVFSILTAAISTAIELYILFQIRSYYN